MPKIRHKEIFKDETGQYIKKSGILSRSINNILKKEISFKSFFKNSFLHSDVFSDNNIIPYDDNKTYYFNNKIVNNTFPLEEKYKSDNRILHTPNEFDTSSTIEKNITNVIHNRFSNHDYVDQNFSSFNDSYFVNKQELEKEDEVINIKINFNDPCRLSFNKNTSENVNQTVEFEGTTYNCINSSMAYFDFKNNRWDYLGNIKKNYFAQITDFKEAPIGFKSVKNTLNTKINNQVSGTPINTFGFPFDSRYRGFERHFLKLENYITQNFILEKVKIRFSGTLNAESPDSSTSFYKKNVEILNSLNFFIINQRKNLNSDSLQNLNLNSGEINFYNANTLENDSETIEFSVSNIPIYSQISNINSENEKINISDSFNLSNDADDKKSSQRELVTFINLVNYGSGGINPSESVFDLDSIKNNADVFYEENSLGGNSYFSKINYTNKHFDVISDVKTPVYAESLDNITQFNIYPEAKYNNRTGTGYRTERSIKSDYTSFKNTIESVDDLNNTVYLGNKYTKNNSYILHPTDNLIFGFSFNPNMTLDNTKLGKDIFTLHDNIEISLIGKYYQNNEKINISKNYFKNNNYKRLLFFEQKYASDRILCNNMYLNKGAYYDSNKGPFTLDTTNFTISFNNIDSGAKFYNSNNILIKAKTFSGFFKVFSIDEEAFDYENEKNISYYLSYFSHGINLSRFNSHKMISFKDTRKNKYYYSVIQKFRNNIFKEIESTISNNTDIYLRLVYDNNTQSYFRE